MTETSVPERGGEPHDQDQLFDVAVIGSWHLAFVTATCLADAGHRVALVTLEDGWRSVPAACPVHEPGIDDRIADLHARGLLGFEVGLKSDWSAPVVWLAIDTPVNNRDEPDTAPLLEVAREVSSRPDVEIFATSSQVPIGFGAQLEELLGPKIAYIPENLRLGQGIATFAQADRTVIGASTEFVGARVHALMDSFDTEFLHCDLATAEMVKHANNAFLATSISFANEMARIGMEYGVDSYLVARALKLDSRIGPRAYVAPGLGFAGGTLPRDLRVLEQAGRKTGVAMPLTRAVLEVNDLTGELVADIVCQYARAAEAGSDSSRSRVLILGYTYKADTDTLRRSLSLDVARALTKRGLRCHGFDPFMNDKDLAELDDLIIHHDDLADVPPGAVALLMTARPDFRATDWRQWGSGEEPAVMIDTQGFLDGALVRAQGLRYRRLWSAAGEDS